MISAIGTPFSYLYTQVTSSVAYVKNYLHEWHRSELLQDPPVVPLARRDVEEIRFRRGNEIRFDPTLAPRCPRNVNPIYNTAARVNDLAPIPNGGNTCFFAALTQAFFARDPEILQAFRIAVDHAPEGRDKQALVGIYNYLKIYRNCQIRKEAVPREETNRIRESLRMLGMEGDGPVQQDAEEALTLIMGKLLDHLPQDTALFHSKIYTISVLDDILSWFSWLWSLIFGRTPDQLDPTDLTVFDPARKIFWENPEPNNPGKIELSFGPQDDFSTMIRNYFFERGQNATIRRQNIGGIEKNFRIVSKRKVYERAPVRLNFTLKRFDAMGRKINSPVQGIGEELHLPAKYFIDNTGANYRLDGVVIHQGVSMQQGHYYAIRRVVDENGIHSYLLADDKEIRAITQRDFERYLSQSYILFYKKV